MFKFTFIKTPNGFIACLSAMVIFIGGLFPFHAVAQVFPAPEITHFDDLSLGVVEFSWNVPENPEVSSYNIYKNGALYLNTTDTVLIDTSQFYCKNDWFITALYTNPDGESDSAGIMFIYEANLDIPSEFTFEDEFEFLTTRALNGNRYWEFSDQDSYTGNWCAKFLSDSNNFASIITSPPYYTYDTLDGLKLSFWYKIPPNQGLTDTLYFLYKDLNNNDTIFGPLYSEPDWTYQEVVIYHENWNHFGFTARTGGGNGVYLDDINLFEYTPTFPQPTITFASLIGPNVYHLEWDPPEREVSSYKIYKSDVLIENTTNTYFIDTLFFAYQNTYKLIAVYENPDGESEPIVINLSIPELQTFPYFQDFEDLYVVLATEPIYGDVFWEPSQLESHSGVKSASFFSDTYGYSSKLVTPGFVDINPNEMVQLEFWYKTIPDQNNFDDLFFSFKGDSIWQQIGPFEYSEEWASFDTLIPFSYGSAIGFKAICNGGGGINLDDISMNTINVGLLEGISNDAYLSQNFPNPCNNETLIYLHIPSSGQYDLSIIDMRGRKVQQVFDQFLTAGNHQYIIDVSTLKKGIYVYNLKGSQLNLSKKIIVH